MMAAALIAVTMWGVVAFVVGFVCGDANGQRRARIKAFNDCIDWAALAMKGNQVWRRLTVADALLKAGTLIGGSDVMPPLPAEQPRFVFGRPEFTKGNQA